MEFENNKYGKIHVSNLIDEPKYVGLVASWIEEEWGYIRKKGIQFRQEFLKEFIKDNGYPNLYLLSIKGEIIGMFSIEQLGKYKQVLLLNYL